MQDKMGTKGTDSETSAGHTGHSRHGWKTPHASRPARKTAGPRTLPPSNSLVLLLPAVHNSHHSEHLSLGVRDDFLRQFANDLKFTVAESHSASVVSCRRVNER